MSIKEISEAEKDRLNIAMVQVLQEHEKSRADDLQQAQDLINKAQTIVVYTLGAMLALPVIQQYIAMAGLLFIINNALGTYNKYKSRIETRLRANVLRKWHFKGDYKAMKSFDCIPHNISIEEVTFGSIFKCKASIVFTYVAFILTITVVSYFNIPSMVKSPAVSTTISKVVSSVKGDK